MPTKRRSRSRFRSRSRHRSRPARRRSTSRSRAIKCVPAKRSKKIPRLKTRRRSLPAGAFALPETRRYPIPDAYHATLALTFLLRTIGRHGPRPDEAKKVLSAIRHFWPDVYDCEYDLVSEIKAKSHIRTIPRYKGVSKAKFRRASVGLKRKVKKGRVRKIYKKRRSRSRSRTRSRSRSRSRSRRR